METTVHNTSTVNEWKALYTLTYRTQNEMLGPSRRQREMEPIRTSQFVIKHSITMHRTQEFVMPGHKQLFTLLVNSAGSSFLYWQILLYLEFWFC